MSEPSQSPRSVVNGIGAAFVGQDSGTLPFGVRIGVHAVELIEPIPNNPPHAVADSITAPEDGSTVFNPSFNDTDPDGDPLWVKFVEGETANGRTYWEEGGNIRYIPNPDYHGPDSFGYLVTDGLDQYEGTVTVTVNPVNDAPVSFNDGGAYASGMAVTHKGIPQTMTISVPVLANDIDYDGLAADLRVHDVSPSGSVAISADKKAVEWTVPNGHDGSIEFSYQTKDGQGAVSGWATAKVRAYPSTVEPPRPRRRPSPPRTRPSSVETPSRPAT
jgi:hypothetical protein